MQRGEELARQSENALRLAKQRLEFARKRLEEEQALELEEMAKENRRKLAEAIITELELTENLSEAAPEIPCLALANTVHKPHHREGPTGSMM